MKRRYQCSGTQYTEVNKDLCLTCARSEKADCGMGYAFLSIFWKWTEGSAARQGIHVSDLTGCLRRAYYDKTRVTSSKIHDNLVLLLGTLAHSMFEVDDVYYEAELKLKALDIVGSADIVYKDGIIVDVKTTRWLSPDKLPYSSHATQVNIYAQLLREMGREIKGAYIQYIDMTGPTKCRKCKTTIVKTPWGFSCPDCGKDFPTGHNGAMLFPIPLWSETNAKEYIETRRDILKLGLATQVPPEKETSWLCDYCDHFQECMHGSRPENIEALPEVQQPVSDLA